MATIGDVLRHLLALVPGPSADHQAELLDAVNAEYPPPPPEPEPDPAADAAAAEIADLKARLADAEAKAAGG